MDTVAVDRDRIFTEIRSLLADSLALSAQKIGRESRLIDDLGADSLDFIDVLFGLEKRFGIKAREGELDFVSRLDFSSPQVMQKGYLTRETVARLTDWLPALGRVADPGKVTPSALFSFITVETLCLLVERKLAAR